MYTREVLLLDKNNNIKVNIHVGAFPVKFYDLNKNFQLKFFVFLYYL